MKTSTRFAYFFAIQVILYVLLVFNFRAVAQARLGWTIISDTLIAFFGFTAVKRISESKTHVEKAGYVLGSAAGSGIGILISRYLFGQ